MATLYLHERFKTAANPVPAIVTASHTGFWTGGAGMIIAAQVLNTNNLLATLKQCISAVNNGAVWKPILPGLFHLVKVLFDIPSGRFYAKMNSVATILGGLEYYVDDNNFFVHRSSGSSIFSEVLFGPIPLTFSAGAEADGTNHEVELCVFLRSITGTLGVAATAQMEIWAKLPFFPVGVGHPGGPSWLQLDHYNVDIGANTTAYVNLETYAEGNNYLSEWQWGVAVPGDGMDPAEFDGLRHVRCATLAAGGTAGTGVLYSAPVRQASRTFVLVEDGGDESALYTVGDHRIGLEYFSDSKFVSPTRVLVGGKDVFDEYAAGNGYQTAAVAFDGLHGVILAARWNVALYPAAWDIMARTSSDGGLTWSDPAYAVMTYADAEAGDYLQVGRNAARVNGQWIFSYFTSYKGATANGLLVASANTPAVTDWTLSAGAYAGEEPVLLRQSTGRLLMLAREAYYDHYAIWAAGVGNAWTEVEQGACDGGAATACWPAGKPLIENSISGDAPEAIFLPAFGKLWSVRKPKTTGRRRQTRTLEYSADDGRTWLPHSLVNYNYGKYLDASGIEFLPPSGLLATWSVRRYCYLQVVKNAFAGEAIASGNMVPARILREGL